jgi:RecA-family ATPase
MSIIDLELPERLCAPLSINALRDLAEWWWGGPEPQFSPPLSLGWDIHRRWPNEEGFALWRDMMHQYEPPFLAAELLEGDQRQAETLEQYETALVERWALYDREKHWVDKLIVDVMHDERARGFEPGGEGWERTEAILNDLAAKTGAKRAAAKAEEDARETRRLKRLDRYFDLDDAGYAKWLADGRPDGEGLKFERWDDRHFRERLEKVKAMSVVPFPAPAAPPKLRTISAASFAGKPAPEREELVRGLIPAKIIGGLYGDGAVGKSLLAMMLGVCVATGRPWLNRIVQKGPVVYVCCEDDEAEVHRRLENICREMGVDMATLGDFHIVPLADEDSVLASSDGRSNVLTATPLYAQLVELTRDVRPQLLIGDTLNDIFAGSENDRMQAKQFVKLMRPLVIPHGGTGLILAHPSVDGMRSGRGTSGTTGWNNSFRWRGYLDKVLDEQGNEPDPTRRVLRTKKLNYGPQGGEIELRYQNGCYALGFQESMADPLAKAARADRVFLELLRKHLKQNNHVSVQKKGSCFAPAVFAAEAAKQGVSRADLKEAMQRLIDSNTIENAPFGARSRNQFRLYVNP